MKFIFNRKFIVIGLLATFISSAVSMFTEEEEFQTSLKKASQLISVSVIDHDDLSIQSSIDHLQSDYFRQLQLRTAENKVYQLRYFSRTLHNRARNEAAVPRITTGCGH